MNIYSVIKRQQYAANPTWGDIFESSKLKARTSLLPRFTRTSLFTEPWQKRRSSFELWALKQRSKMSPQVRSAEPFSNAVAKLKAHSSNVSFARFQRKETLELWALKELSKMSPLVGLAVIIQIIISAKYLTPTSTISSEYTVNPTWGDIFECCFKAQSSKLERLSSLKRGKRDVRALSFELSKMSPQVGLDAYCDLLMTE